MDDGWDDKLKELGYDAYSVKKLRADGYKLRTDYSVINYAKENDMILVTRDTESGQACEENGKVDNWRNSRNGPRTSTNA